MLPCAMLFENRVLWMCPLHIEKFINMHLAQDSRILMKIALKSKFCGPSNLTLVKNEFARKIRFMKRRPQLNIGIDNKFDSGRKENSLFEYTVVAKQHTQISDQNEQTAQVMSEEIGFNATGNELALPSLDKKKK
ncbi:hypothetical protein LSTR_LSTR004304 [Laodelphax striatellus]|uniref:Uncharacterized protein n=1 Tax=Laodelphax striatellus TaxID=195883 RepID=A0A482WHD6_LAOST|nr:hypothetical protein LSTR_LSTR004304 [Laodelphax striatellus]